MTRQCSEEAQEHMRHILTASGDSEEVSINQNQVQWIYCGRVRRIKVRAVFLVFLWTLAVSAAGYLIGDIAVDYMYLKKLHAGTIPSIAIIAFFGPLAGWLADIKLGRYRVIQASLWSMWIGIGGFILVDTYVNNVIARKVLNPLCGVPFCCGYSAFMANIIQFAIDQMPEASSEEVSAFTHWFVWVHYFGRALLNILMQLFSCHEYLSGSTGNTFILLFVLGMLTLGLSAGMLFRNTLTLIPESRNPMKTVFRVLRYSAAHKYPENRRAHTYTDSCIPSRLDLGKEIYGGPFTTEQVEDVKTVLHIISIILTTIAVEVSIDLCWWSINLTDHFHSFSKESRCIKIASILTYSEEVIIVICIPLYELFVYPIARKWIPKILHKIIIAVVLNVFLSLFLFILSSTSHYMRDLPCILFTSLQEHDVALLPINYLAVGIPSHFLKALSSMFYSIGLVEFICAQSPYNMKGFLLGLESFAVYFGEGIAIFIQVWWYYRWNDDHAITVPSCDFWYYLMVTIIAVLALVLVVLVVRCYQQRKREEPNYDRMHVENYYEKTH